MSKHQYTVYKELVKQNTKLDDHLSHLTSHSNHLDNIHKVLHQNGDGSGNTAGNMLDSVASSLNDMKQHTNLTASRLNNIQNHLTQDGLGGGTSHGVMLDSCSSSLNTIESNSTLTASRLNNIQNHISSNIVGSQANLMDGASCVAIGTGDSISNVIDFGTAPPRKVHILATATSSIAGTNLFEIYGSVDNSTWSVLMVGGTKSHYMSSVNSGGQTIDTQGSVVVNWAGARYLKIIVFSLGVYTATCIGQL